MKSQRTVTNPSTPIAKLTKGFRDKYSLYIFFCKELTEALNTIIHSKRGNINIIRTVPSHKKASHQHVDHVLTWTWVEVFCSLWLVGLLKRNEGRLDSLMF